MSRASLAWRFLPIALPIAAFFACGGENPPAQAPPPAASAAPPAASASAASDAPVAAASASAAPSAPAPLAAVLMTDPAAIQKMFDAASAAPPATLKQNGATGGDALSRGLRDVAKVAAPGMQPDGPLATGSLKEKQHLQTSVTLRPGKCYAIVGYSSKVKDLDLHLLLPPGILSGEDTTDDNKPVIGRAPDAMCPSASTAVTYRLDILADSGDGDAAVQLYSKDKVLSP